MESSSQVPSPESGDAPDVKAALEAGARSWVNGDTDETLRQLARAAEAAGDAGDDRRALGLARAVAELRDGLALAAVPVASAASPSAPPPSATNQSAAPQSAPPPSAVPSSPPPARQVASASSAPKARSMAPPAPSSRAASMAAPAPRVASVPPNQPASALPPSAIISQGESVAPLAAEVVRVSVKSSVRDPELLLVRVLRKGQVAPPGTREAVLNLPAAKV